MAADGVAEDKISKDMSKPQSLEPPDNPHHQTQAIDEVDFESTAITDKLLLKAERPDKSSEHNFTFEHKETDDIIKGKPGTSSEVTSDKDLERQKQQLDKLKQDRQKILDMKSFTELDSNVEEHDDLLDLLKQSSDNDSDIDCELEYNPSLDVPNFGEVEEEHQSNLSENQLQNVRHLNFSGRVSEVEDTEQLEPTTQSGHSTQHPEVIIAHNYYFYKRTYGAW